MHSPRVHLKVYAEASSPVELDAFVPIFHRWIRERLLSELVLDVVDYKHVHHGPGVVLIGHGSDYYLDQGEGRLGLLYSRKRNGPPANELLLDAFRRAFHACNLLERDPSLATRLSFRTGDILLRFPDRLRVENDEAGLDKIRPELESVARSVYGDQHCQLERVDEPRGPLSVRLKVDGAPPLGALLDRIGPTKTGARLRVL